MNQAMTLKDYFTELRTATLLAGKEVLTVEEAALYTGYTTSYLYALKSKGEVPCYKRGNAVFFKKSELADWLTANRIPTRSERLREYADRERAKNNPKIKTITPKKIQL